MTSFAAAAQAFTAGSVQAVLATTPAQQAELLHHHGAVARNSLTFGFVDLLFNASIPGLDDPAVRHAIADAIDRDAIVNGPLDGLGTGQYGPIPAGILWLQGEEPAQLRRPRRRRGGARRRRLADQSRGGAAPWAGWRSTSPSASPTPRRSRRWRRWWRSSSTPWGSR